MRIQLALEDLKKKKKTKETVKREQEREGGWSRKAERNSDCGIWNTKCVF